MKVIRLRPGRERSLRHRHPWVFDGAVASGRADAGETVRVESADGTFLAWGAFSPASRIRVRAWSFDEAERIDRGFFARCVASAVASRQALAIDSDGQRLVHAEADGLPALVVDRYGDTLVAQFGAAGVERWRETIADALLATTGCTRLYERSDAALRQLEGLDERTGWLRGDGDTAVTIREHGWRLTLDVARGHKTGYYLDQRDNRARFATLVRQFGAKRVLNCFSYTGGFTVAALAGGAHEVISVDSSGPALAHVADHVRLNGFVTAASRTVEADANRFLREALAAGERFDAIVLDPPKFAPTAASADRAARAYKDINRLALQLLAPGGLLLTFSCSGGIAPDLFHKIVAGAAMDAGVDAFILERLAAAPDHAATLFFPEGDYLKGLVLRRR
ncbi:class I SAM-dependent rRNA methyltransferase [Rubrivivax albus]|uniref:23S rRNA (Cytosine(1962)-C(5))-methyltransferase RlmI n=1 Tax=Rubrivivax albus TaxID=2499835 RepID=A0A3S2U8X7_9BURK|nr:class I SAM-dependent methyltransferase [Rubrivivax albus]RVT51543.1 23S rRNA (cytosine(1962)-C(5))-methyltransferase RlmI [Rubrivivax albus]